MEMAYDIQGATVETLPLNGPEVTAMLHQRDGKYRVTAFAHDWSIHRHRSRRVLFHFDTPRSSS